MPRGAHDHDATAHPDGAADEMDWGGRRNSRGISVAVIV